MNAFEIGDRFPDVPIWRDGATQGLYNVATGKPFLLVWGADAALPAGVAEIAREIGADMLHLVPEGARNSAHVTQVLAPEALRLRAVAALDGAGGLLLEPSMRVLARVALPAQDPEQVIDKLREALRLAGVGVIDTAADHAPVLLVPRVLEPELIAQVIAWFRATGEGHDSGVIVHEKGEAQFRLDPAVKMRREARIEDPVLDAVLHDRLLRRVLPEIARAFAFEVKQREAFKVLRYVAGGGYFRAHRDNDSRDVAHRRFAMTLNLNSGEYTGGRLRFPEFGCREYEAPSGGALLFSCALLHEVTDLTAGTRYAMTSFFF